MNLPKAIELNKEAEKSLRDHNFIEHADAVKIGGEAMKRLEKGRRVDHAFACVKLPGETED
jgi:hypothetical protein